MASYRYPTFCMFGTDVLRQPGVMLSPDECFIYRAESGDLQWVPSTDTAGLTLGLRVMDDTEPSQQASRLRLREQALEALVRNIGRVLRWGGSSTCSVLAHSVRVAHLAAAIARALGWTEVDQAVCRRLGALHDVHEGLPGVGGVPNPTLRLLRHAVPLIDHMHRVAEELVLNLAGARSLVNDGTHDVVKMADRLAATIERAAYFGDVPPWMGPNLCRAGERMLRSPLPRMCTKADAVSDRHSKHLLSLIRGDVPTGDDARGWNSWCEDVLVCLTTLERPWQSVLGDMVRGT